MTLILSCVLSLFTVAHADLDPLSGTRAALVTTQKTLAAPFLPSLGSDKRQIGVQASYLVATLKAAEPNTGLYGGQFTGGSFGISFSPPLQKNLGYFGSAVLNRTVGLPTAAGAPPGTVFAFDTTGLAGTIGANLRIVGRDDAASIVSVFGGASVMHFRSRLVIGPQTFTSTPYILGANVGVQWRVTLGKFVFNPYALHFQSVSDACTRVQTASGTVEFPGHCPGDTQAIALKPSFSAYGLVFGYGKLQLNVYAKLINDPVLKETTVQNYALSYMF